MKRLHCLCRSREHAPYLERDGISVVRCLGCGLIRTLDQPDDPLALYLDGYHEGFGGARPWKKRFEHDVEIGRMRMAAHLRHGHFRSALDVGCANGGFLAALREVGISAKGIEPNALMAEFASFQSGCRIVTSWQDAPERYDLVTFHDVIEHVAEPGQEIQTARRRLTASGLLVLDTPDGDTLEGAGARHVKPREHLWYFGEKHLRRLLEQNEMRVEAIERPIPGKLVAYATRGKP